MLKFRILLLSFFLAITTLQAQVLTQTIRGRVVDRESEQPLPGVAVLLLSVNPEKGVATDANGNFELKNVPVGRHTLKVKMVGYQEQTLPNLLVGSGKEIVLNIGLGESFVQMQEVVIKAHSEKDKALNDMATVSARSFSVDETQRYAASVDDPARMAQAFAGVANTDDASNEIIIRGNSPKGLLWRLNGVEIPSPNHFSDEGSSGGGVSAINNNVLDNSDFMTGAFPAEYGNAMSGVFDVKLRKGNNQKYEFATQLGVLGTDIAAEGPFKKGYAGSFLINYRYSTLGLLTQAGILNIGDNNTYQDLALNVNLPSSRFGTFGVFALGGLSASGDVVEKDSSKWKLREDGFKYTFHSDMGVAGVSHQYFLDANSYIKTTLAATGQRISFDRDSISPARNYEAIRYNKDAFINMAYRLSTYLNKKLNQRHTLRTGVIVSRLDYNLVSEGNNGTGRYVSYISDNDFTYTLQAYAQWKYKLTEKWTLNAGVHYLQLQLNKDKSIEPRLGLRYQLNSKQSFSFGAGLHSRMEAMSMYNAYTIDSTGVIGRANQSLKFTRALHVIASYDWLIGEQLRLKTEVYYQDLFKVPVSTDKRSTYSLLNESDGFTDQVLQNTGTAFNRGLELTLEKFFGNRYYYLVTGSLFESKYRDANKAEHSTRYSSGYRCTILGGKEFPVGKSKQNIFEFNGKLIYAGGNRYTPIDLTQSIQEGETILINSSPFSKQVPDYWRFDLTLNYRINRPGKAHIISLQVQNVSNRENVFGYNYNAEKREIEAIYQFGLIPVLKYRFEF